MNEIIKQSIKKAEDDFNFCCNIIRTENYSDFDKYVDAVKTLFGYACHIKLRAKDLIFVIEDLPEDYELYKILVKQFKILVDDEDMIAKKYGGIYLKYLGERNKNQKSEDEIIKDIILTCKDRVF